MFTSVGGNLKMSTTCLSYFHFGNSSPSLITDQVLRVAISLLTDQATRNNTLPSSPDNAGVVTVARHFSRAEEVNMIEVPIPEPPSPREEVIQILAEGLWELVVRGRRPDKAKEQPESMLRDREDQITHRAKERRD